MIYWAAILDVLGQMAEVPRDAGFWAGILKQVSRRMRGSEDSEDLLHTAYIRLERYRAQHDVDSPAGFLVRAAVNINVDNHRRNRIMATEAMDAYNFEIADHAPLQDEVFEARARLQRVKTGLAQLSPRTREVFLMHRIEEKKYREIAVELGISKSAVEKHVAKAVLFLTKWMEGW